MKYVKLRPNEKAPAGDHWEISDDPSLWLAQGFNVGLMLKESNIVTVDFDRDIEAAREHYRQTLCQVIVETIRGFHFHYLGVIEKSRKFEHGDIKGTGYVVYPPSTVDGHRYKFIKKGELQPFPEKLFPVVVNAITSTTTGIKNAMKYITTITAHSGQGGHNATYRAACKLRDAGLDEAEALAAMVEWNLSNATPPWTTKELLHKVRSAFAKGRS